MIPIPQLNLNSIPIMNANGKHGTFSIATASSSSIRKTASTSSVMSVRETVTAGGGSGSSSAGGWVVNNKSRFINNNAPPVLAAGSSCESSPGNCRKTPFIGMFYGATMGYFFFHFYLNPLPASLYKTHFVLY